MNIRLGGIILVVMVAMILSACGGGGSSEGGLGTYVFIGTSDVKSVTSSSEEGQARFEFVIPAPKGNTLVTLAETHRAETGAGAVSYILASVDNTEGSEAQSIPDITARRQAS